MQEGPELWAPLNSSPQHRSWVHVRHLERLALLHIKACHLAKQRPNWRLLGQAFHTLALQAGSGSPHIILTRRQQLQDLAQPALGHKRFPLGLEDLACHPAAARQLSPCSTAAAIITICSHPACQPLNHHHAINNCKNSFSQSRVCYGTGK